MFFQLDFKQQGTVYFAWDRPLHCVRMGRRWKVESRSLLTFSWPLIFAACIYSTLIQRYLILKGDFIPAAFKYFIPQFDFVKL